MKKIFILVVIIAVVIGCSIFSGVKIVDLELTSSSIKGILKNNSATNYKAVHVEFSIFNAAGERIYQQAESFQNVKAKEERAFEFKRYDSGGVKIEVKRIIKEK